MKAPPNNFITTKEELLDLKKGFDKEALPLADFFFNLTFQITFDKRLSKKIFKDIYYKAIEYCDKTMGGSGWTTWMQRIWMKSLFDHTGGDKYVDFNFELIDHWVPVKEIQTKISNDEKEILAALLKLPLILRITLMMKTCSSFYYPLIGELIDIPDGTVSTRIYRARKLLYNFIIEDDISQIDLNDKQKTFPGEKIIFNMRKSAEIADNQYFEGEDEKSKRNLIENDEHLLREFTIQKTISTVLSESIIKKTAPKRILSKISRKAKKKFSISTTN